MKSTVSTSGTASTKDGGAEHESVESKDENMTGLENEERKGNVSRVQE